MVSNIVHEMHTYKICKTNESLQIASLFCIVHLFSDFFCSCRHVFLCVVSKYYTYLGDPHVLYIRSANNETIGESWENFEPYGEKCNDACCKCKLHHNKLLL